MAQKLLLRWFTIEIDSHVERPTHYIQRIDIVDETGRTVATVTAYGREGLETAKEARRLAHETIARVNKEDDSPPE